MFARVLLLVIVVLAMEGNLDASQRYKNEKYCFSVATPVGMRVARESQDGAGAVFTFRNPCGLDDPTCNFIDVSAGYLTYSRDADPLTELTKKYESEGWASKSDGTFGHAKGWRQQALFKGSGDQQREVHIFVRTVRREETAVGYEIVGEFYSSERKAFAKSVQEVLTSWRLSRDCES